MGAVFALVLAIAGARSASASDTTASPFGFLGTYIDSPTTRRNFAAYGGFGAVQKFYRELGVHWDRGSGLGGGATWGALEKDVDGYRGTFARYVSVAEANGIHLLITIDPVFSAGRRGLPSPGRLDAYAQFVKRTVSGAKWVKHWQIHNEVNGGVFWRDTPANYAKLVGVTSNAIRAACPDCVVVLGSSINIDARGAAQPVARYFGPVLHELQATMPRAFDVFDYHFFASRDAAPGAYVQALGPELDALRVLLNRNGFANSEIWITETMLPTTDGMSAAELRRLPSSFRRIGEQEQAEALVKTCIIALSKGVKKVFWNKLTEGRWFDFMFNRAGMVRHPALSGSTAKKLSFYAYQRMVQTLAEAEVSHASSERDSSGHVYAVSKRGGTFWIAWSDSAEGEDVAIRPAAKAVRVSSFLPAPSASAGKRIIPVVGEVAKIFVRRGPVLIEAVQ